MSSTEHYEPPPNGFRTFLIVWVTQSISIFGNGITFFATTIWLTQVLYPRDDQKPELALAISAIALPPPCRLSLARPSRGPGPTGMIASTP